MRTQGQRRLKRKIQRRDAIIAGLTIASLTGTVLPAWASRQAPAELSWCDIHTVSPGDTVSHIAANSGLTLTQVAELNRQIGDLDLIYPGDQIVTRCAISSNPPSDLKTAAPIETALADHSLVDVSQWLDEREPDGRLTWRAVISLLYVRGVEGNDLLTLAAITEPESARHMDRPGDTTITDKTWGPSIGAWQIRSVWAQRGTGQTRDPDRLATPEGNADATVALYESAKQKRAEGKVHPVTKQLWTPFSDWTAFQRGWVTGVIPTVRQVAESMGVL